MSNEHALVAERAVKHLALTTRGRSTLAILTDLNEESSHLDKENTAALLDLVTAMASHQVNGTIYELLHEHLRNTR
jgi:allophanate hydrolase subunit 1